MCNMENIALGGKQAVLQLAGLTSTDKSDRAIVLSKQENETPVCCEFVISKLIKYGWEGQIEPCSLTDDTNASSGFKNFINIRAPELNNVEYHGTLIFIKMNTQLKSMFNNINEFRYNTSINFYKCLKRCEFWCGLSLEDLKRVEMYDPLHYDEVDVKYKSETTVEYYTDVDNQYFVIDGQYLPIKNKIGHVSSVFTKFDTKDKKKYGEFKVRSSMIYEYLHRKKYDFKKDILNVESENCIYLCRNGSVIGTYAKFKYPARRTSHKENISRWVRVRISIMSTSNLNNALDSIFGVNMNKGLIMYNSLPKILQKTLEGNNVIFCKDVKKKLLGEVDLVKLNKKFITMNTSTFEINRVNTVSPITIKEKEIQTRLSKDENGICEVRCGGKFIDVLTDKYVIEIKRYEDRFDALKVLFYYEYYLDHKPRIHLFNQYGKKCPREPMFQRVCDKYNIKLTYEI